MEFALKVISSFLVGGGYVFTVVWLAEQLGSRIGAAIAGLPSTILVGLIFIVLTEGAEAGREATAIVPFMFSAALIYALVYSHMASIVKIKLRYPIAVVAASAGWLMYSLVIRQLTAIAFLYVAAFGLISLLGFWYALRGSKNVDVVRVKLPKNIHFLRFTTGGTIIACSVMAARLLDPSWGGIVASFPAMLGVILYFLSKSQGENFLKGFIKNLPISYISSLTFLVIVHQTLTNLPAAFGFALGMLGAGSYMLLLIQFKRITPTSPGA